MPTEEYVGLFLGGRGFAVKIYWSEVSPMVRAFAPENRLIFATGPLAGFPGLAGSRWMVAGKAPATDTTPEQFSYSNFGGSWGAQLKFAGYDALVVQGKSYKPVYLLIQDDNVEIRDASSLWGKGTIEVRDTLKAEFGDSLRVVACGPAGERGVSWATLLADDDSSGSGGFGAVMGAKNLKAVAVRGMRKVIAARQERLRELTAHLRYFKVEQPLVLIEMMSEVTLPKTKRQVCFGCIAGCVRSVCEAENGTRGKTFCFSALTYMDWAERYYRGKNEVPFWANRICDSYGLDVYPLRGVLVWLDKCYREGILSEEETEIPLSRIGSLEFIQTLVSKIALREGFGDILAQGIRKAAEVVGGGAEEQLVYSLFYDPRMYLTTGIFHAMEPRIPIQQLHEIARPVLQWLEWLRGIKGAFVSSEVLRKVGRRFWGDELAVDFSTYEGKALCAKMIQDRNYAKESLILCDYPWPVTTVRHSTDHVGDSTLESQLLSAVTGRDIDEAGLYLTGERIFNLQRAILAREGHQGWESDKLPEFVYTVPLDPQLENPGCLAPGKNGEAISMMGNILDRDEFQRMMAEYYELRGWDVASGFQTREKLEELDLGDVAQDLAGRGLVA